MKEIWKDIPEYEGLYQASNLGRIRRNKDNYIFKENIASNGYRVVTLTKNKKGKTLTVHRLIAKTFIPNPENKEQINHKDGNKINNNINNLEWCTGSENMIHAYKNNLQVKEGKKVIQYDLDMNIIKIWDKMIYIEKELNIGHSHVSQVCNFKRKTTGGYIWRFYE